MDVVICPDLRRADYEAHHEAERVGGIVRSGGRLERPDGEVTLYMSVKSAYHRLRGLRLTGVRWVERHRMPLYERAAVYEIAQNCMKETRRG